MADIDWLESNLCLRRTAARIGTCPYVVAYAQGKWYAVTWDRGPDAPRVFRVDRVLDVTPGEAFELRDDFDGNYVLRSQGSCLV